MKTHEIAVELAAYGASGTLPPKVRLSLEHVIKLLQGAPNIDIDDVRLLKKSDDIAVGIRLLASLSKYTKQQWLGLIEEYGLDISLNPRDSTRDVVGKVLRYLDEHPEALRTKRRSTKKDASSASELENALSKLLSR